MLTKLHNGVTTQLTDSLGIDFGITAFIVLMFLVMIHLFVTKWLWNNVLVKLVPSINKATSMWQMLGLTILMSFVIPS